MDFNSKIMSLHVRIRELCKAVKVSQAKLAEGLGLRQPQFNGYLNEKSEKNLWEHLPRILALYPQVRRDWLYFGEGGMFSGDKPENCPQQPSHDSDELARLKAELAELNTSYIRLLEKHVKLLSADGQKPGQGEKTEAEQGQALRLDEESGGYSGDGSGLLQEGSPKYLPKNE